MLASEASALRRKSIDSSMVEIFKEIKAAATEGHSSINYPDLTHNQRERLRAMGYDLRQASPTSITTIYWKDA